MAYGDYSLADIETHNLIGSYASEDAALRDVVDTIKRYGLHSAEVRTLALSSPRGLVAKGTALARRALQRFPVNEEQGVQLRVRRS